MPLIYAIKAGTKEVGDSLQIRGLFQRLFQGSPQGFRQDTVPFSVQMQIVNSEFGIQPSVLQLTVEHIQIDNVRSLQFPVYFLIKHTDEFIHRRTVIIVIIAWEDTE